MIIKKTFFSKKQYLPIFFLINALIYLIFDSQFVKIAQGAENNLEYNRSIELTYSGDKNSITPLNSAIADKILDNNVTIAAEKYVMTKNNQHNNRLPVIVIDAGHGGKDSGAIGKYGRTKEKNITLAYAKELKRYLDRSGKFKTYLTRNKDYFMALSQRVKKARKVRANLFISIHADSSHNKKATGLSIYTLSEKSSDKQAAKLARKENKSDIIGGVNFANTSGDILKTLIALSQRNSMNSSAIFAQTTIKILRKDGVSIMQNTHRFAGFRVLTAPDMASVLVEIGYLSNKYEERQLNKISYRKKIAQSMVKAVKSYFKDVKE